MSRIIEEPHRPDDDPTDELPTLSEALADGQPLPLLDAAQLEDDAVPLPDDAYGLRELDHSDTHAYDAEPIEDGALTERERVLEQRLAERETEIVALMRQVANLRVADQERRRTEERLVTKLEQRSGQVKRLLEKLRLERLKIDESQARLEAEKERTRAARSELEQTRLQLFHWRLLAREASVRASSSARRAGAAVRGVAVRYIANPSDWWQDMRARIDAYRRRFLRVVAGRSSTQARDAADAGKREKERSRWQS